MKTTKTSDLIAAITISSLVSTHTALSVLRGELQHDVAKAILCDRHPVGAEVAESSEPAEVVQLVGIHRLLEAVSINETLYRTQYVHAVACLVSVAEEPDEGKPHVRFRERH